MKKQFLVFLFLLTLVFSVSAQFKETVKIDEFENPNCEDIKARLDTFANVLRAEPQARGYAIFYDGKYTSYLKRKAELQLPVFGESIYRSQFMIKYLKFQQQNISDRTLFINGGFRENQTIEFWIVPKGKNAPNPSPTVAKMNYRKGKIEGFDCAEE